MEEKKLFIKEVMPGIFLMDEAHEATGYLVVGNERACVIDTMNGYCDLREAVRGGGPDLQRRGRRAHRQPGRGAGEAEPPGGAGGGG